MVNEFYVGRRPDGILDVEGYLPIEAHGVGVVVSRKARRHIERFSPHFILLFVRQGVLYIEEDGYEFEVGEGQSLLLWPGRLHRGTRDYDEKLHFFWLHFSMTPLKESQTTLRIPQHAQLSRPDFVTELFRRYLDDEGRGNLQPLGAGLYAWMILNEVAAALPSIDAPSTKALAARVRNYILTHLHERISVADVAFAVGYNAQYIGRIYRQTYRMSLAAAIRRERINHAKWLLLHSQKSIGTIAQTSGFEDVSYFQRVFKQLEGITPLQFRRLHTHMNISY